MARIRTIKPEFWTDEKIVELSPLARLLFIGLWNFADDEGRMVFSQTRIKLQILPADSADISELLGEIRGKKLIIIYAVEGVEYLQIVNFGLHQKVDKRTASKYPPPTGTPAESPRIPLTEGIKEGIKEGNGEPKTPRGSRLNSTVFPEDWKVFCLTERSDLDPEKTFASFADHWKSVPGTKGVKLDWDATWRNWVRSQWTGRGPKPAPEIRVDV
jgi:hypothetical protein